MFRAWPQDLPQKVELCAIQLPGRENRMLEEPFDRLPPLIDAVREALESRLDKPFAFFGHSLGALVGFELARRLRREGGPQPEYLFVSGSGAPQLPDLTPNTYDLPDAEFVEELRRLNGTPEEVLDHPELMRLIIPMLRADFAVCQTYLYKDEPPLACPITAFGGLSDQEVSRDQVEAWREQTTSFSCHMLDGDHFFLHSARPLILQVISRELAFMAREFF